MSGFSTFFGSRGRGGKEEGAVTASDSNVTERKISDTFSKTDQFGLAFSLLEGIDYDVFVSLLEIFHQIRYLDLSKQVNQSIDDPVKMWSHIDSFSDWSLDDVRNALNGTNNLNEGDKFRAAGVQLYEMGTRSVDLGFSKLWDLSSYPQNFRTICKDSEGLSLSAYLFKKEQLKNAIKSIVDVLPINMRPGSSDSSRYNKVYEMVKEFDKGKFNYKLTRQVKLPKETGLALPHTMTPKSWLSWALVRLSRALFGSNVFLTFLGDGQIDACRFNGDYLLVSKSTESPYFISNHPGLYDWGESENGEWEWREVVREHAKMVEMEYSNSAQIDKVKYLDQALCDYLTRLEAHNVRFSSYGFVSQYDGKFVLNFFKQGISNLLELMDNPEYLHVLSMNVIKDVSNDFVKVALPDHSSFVAIPSSLWELTEHENSFFSKEGFEIRGEMLDTKNVTLIYQLSHTFAYMDYLYGSAPSYSPDAHAAKLRKAMSGSKSNSVLFSSSLEDRENALTVLEMTTKGGSGGLILHATRSKIGSRTKDKVTRNDVYTSVKDGFSSLGDKLPKRKKGDYSTLFGVSEDSAIPEEPEDDPGESNIDSQNEDHNDSSDELLDNLLDEDD